MAKCSEPMLATAREAAELCGRSVRTWRSWDSAGYIPRPLRIGRTPLWRVDELKAWIVARCPSRAEWELHPANPAKSA